MPWPLYSRERPGIVQEVGWASGAKNLAPARIRSLDRPARSESLYQLRYPGSSYVNEFASVQLSCFICLRHVMVFPDTYRPYGLTSE